MRVTGVLLASVAAALVLVAAGCGLKGSESPVAPAPASPLSGVPPGPSSRSPSPEASATVIMVMLRDFAVAPRALKVRPGLVRFQVTNRGSTDHDFHIPALEPHHRHEQHVLKPGQTKTFDCNVKAGTYQVLCSMPGYRDAGMTGTLDATPQPW